MKKLELELNKNLLLVEFPGEHYFTYKRNEGFMSDGVFFQSGDSHESLLIEGDFKLICMGDQLTEEIAKGLVNISCFVCGGDGKETCTNPDHGFIGFGSPISFLGANESRCPCCGFDPNHKMPNGLECDCCEGKGYILYSEIENKMDEYEFNDACPSALESFISSVEAKGYYWGENPVEKPEVGRDQLYDTLDVSPASVVYHDEYHKRRNRFLEAEFRTFNPKNTYIFEKL